MLCPPRMQVNEFRIRVANFLLDSITPEKKFHFLSLAFLSYQLDVVFTLFPLELAKGMPLGDIFLGTWVQD